MNECIVLHRIAMYRKLLVFFLLVNATAGSSQKTKPSHPKHPCSRPPPVGWPYDASVAARNRYTIDNGGLYTDITFQFLQSSPTEDGTDRSVKDGDLRGKETVAIGAHKAFLAASSPVFRAMFESGMKESWSNVVTIAHAHPDVFFQMIE